MDICKDCYYEDDNATYCLKKQIPIATLPEDVSDKCFWPKEDEINKPNHYNWHPKIECKDVIKYFDACTAQAIKYLFRHEHKGTPIKDLRKAKVWIDEKIKMLEEEE